jgi:hypothetical protein
LTPKRSYGYFDIQRLPLKPQSLNFVDIFYTFLKKIHGYEAWIFLLVLIRTFWGQAKVFYGIIVVSLTCTAKQSGTF